MAKYDILEHMSRVYELASRGYVYPDAMVAAESWFRFRMGDEAFEKALRSGRAGYVYGVDPAEEGTDENATITIVST